MCEHMEPEPETWLSHSKILASKVKCHVTVTLTEACSASVMSLYCPGYISGQQSGSQSLFVDNMYPILPLLGTKLEPITSFSC